MWYDILVVCILLFFLAKGAARGLIWQLASIAGIILCVTFAGTASNLIGPHINLPPPSNQWAVMFITYLLASFVAFGFARTLNQWIDKLELKEYNRHLGAIFGLLKGGLLVLIMTFMIVTFSEKSRSLIQESKAAHIAAKVIHQLEPVVPDKLNAAVSRYIDMFERTGFVQHEVANGEEILPESEQPWPGDGTDLGQPAPFDTTDNVSQPGGNRQQPFVDPQAELSPDLLTQMRGTLGSSVTRLFQEELQNVSPEVKSRIEQTLNDALQSADARTRVQLQNYVVNNGQAGNLVQLLDDWANDILASQDVLPSNSRSAAPVTQNRQSPPQQQPRTNTPTRTNSNPTNVTRSRNTAPTGNQGTAPAPRNTGPTSILEEIVAAKSQFPTMQKKLMAQYNQILDDLPQDVGESVFRDWYGDLTNRNPDIDPGTNVDTSLDERILRQMKARNYSIDQLPVTLKQRLENFMTSSQGASVFR